MRDRSIAGIDRAFEHGCDAARHDEGGPCALGDKNVALVVQAEVVADGADARLFVGIFDVRDCVVIPSAY